ncbi:helix-turn-helix transcriptional regulator [Enterovibrio norvegicus]|uniref:helix-turn-helix transcriptional regulator n=1 Tax=Enterovibrio norvegicus TaxID=188144 RepID=UPI0024B1E493|nr:helix-turn-helix domain-containing protein [Enterovibrio norvegicus]
MLDLNKPVVLDKDIMAFLEISQPTLYRWTKERGFPKAVIRGRRPSKHVKAWLEERGLI